MAFLINSWNEYHALHAKLLSSDNFSETQNYLKFKYDNILEIDFVPFGPIANSDKLLAMPPDWRVILDITGFQEAYDTAELIVIGGNISIKLITVPALAALKVFAWQDRKHITHKDAHDLRIIMENYLDLGNRERFFIQYYELCNTDDFDYEQAGAWLLGMIFNQFCRILRKINL